MPCALTSSIPVDCRDGVGGIEEIKFKELPSATTLTADYTLTSGTITIASGSQTGWFLYDLRTETSNATETGTGNEQNGTWFYDQALSILLYKLSTKLQKEIQLLGQNRLQVAVKLNDGTYWLLGYANGMTVATSAATTGTAFGDHNGYTINLIGREKEPAPNMSAATYDTL